jgi:hypothetical protein
MNNGNDRFERERIWAILDRLPEREYALFRLGWGLFLSLQEADLGHTDADEAYVREVAIRIGNAVSPDSREQFAKWLEPGGVWRLWGRQS